MTYQETVTQLDSLIQNRQYQIDRDKYHDEIWEKDVEALKIASDAVSKHIPKKMKSCGLFTFSNYGLCPTCNAMFRYYTPAIINDYCPRCGQLVDFGNIPWKDHEPKKVRLKDKIKILFIRRKNNE